MERRPAWNETELKMIRDHATAGQRRVIDAILSEGSYEAAAAKLGCGTSNVRSQVFKARNAAAARGIAPDHQLDAPSPPGFLVDRVSTLRGPDGEVKGQWTVARRYAEREEDLLEALREALGDVRAEPLDLGDVYSSPEEPDPDLLAVYPMGDPHLGMYAWAEECGEGHDFDLKIAERDLLTAVDALVGLERRPAAQALIVNLGDFFHADNVQNRTNRSGHALDVDTRWQRVLLTGIRVMRRAIDRALERHERVKVVNAVGNHDDHTSVMLSLALLGYYEDEPRVEVDASPKAFRYHAFGRNLIGITHGDRTKAHDLPGIMATDVPELWGATEYRTWLCGHVHHDSKKEYRGCTVETFRTLAARDAWHTAQGYRSQRDMKMIVLHREHGEVVRHTVGIARLRRSR